MSEDQYYEFQAIALEPSDQQNKPNLFSRQYEDTGVKGINLIEDISHKGITVPDSELKSFQEFWHPSENLPQWDVTIIPP